MVVFVVGAVVADVADIVHVAIDVVIVADVVVIVGGGGRVDA